MGKIYAAKTNHITNPVGFYMEQIVFSWKVKECEGKKQKNARILISEKADFSEILLDIKEAELDSCGTKVDFQTVPYTRYYWKVIVTTDAEEVIESGRTMGRKMDHLWMERGKTSNLFQTGFNRKRS